MKSWLAGFFVMVLVCGAKFAIADAWSPPAGYYDTATGNGATLNSQLAVIMTTGHIQQTYGDFRYAAAIFDQNPANPANILLCYNVSSVPSTWDLGATWNREHVWPDSRQSGNASNSSRGNIGDHHALRPCNPSINESRGNKPFSGATLTGAYRHYGDYYFPGDTDKGNIARCLFYSATRWNMVLVNGFPTGYQMGDLAALLRWHYMDPPDTFERRRNHTIYSSAYNPTYYTNNRNAYVDRPEFVWSVFGGNDNDTMIYVGTTPNVNGSSAITIDLGAVSLKSGHVPAPTNVTLNKAGLDGTYYEIVAPDHVTWQGGTTGCAFDYGAQSTVLNLSVVDVPQQAGQYYATIVVDNLDVCGNSPAGRGSNDGDDVITLMFTVLAADVTGDDQVNIDDLAMLAGNWLEVAPNVNIVDFAGDEPGVINLADLAVLAGEWGI